jgi:hypothetical protein
MSCFLNNRSLRPSETGPHWGAKFGLQLELTNIVAFLRLELVSDIGLIEGCLFDTNSGVLERT